MAFMLLLAMVTVCAAAPHDLTGKMFTFSQETNTAHVRLNTFPQELSAVTVCHRSITDLQRDHALFSMSSPSSDNEVLIYWTESSKEFHPTFRGVSTGFKGWDYKPNTWVSICTTWDSVSGLVQMWVDGKQSLKKITTARSIIPRSTITVLGQDQDNHGGGFDINQSFVGMMSDVHMWNRVLSPCEIQSYTSNMNFSPGNMINWEALDYQIIGNVLLEEKYFCL